MNIAKTSTDLWEYLAKERRPIALYGTGDGADKIIAEQRQAYLDGNYRGQFPGDL